MTRHRLFLSTVAAFLLALPACSVDSAEDTSATADELSLSELTFVQGKVSKGGSITVGYNPADYNSPKLPFIGVELLPTAAPTNVAPRNINNGKEQLAVTVKGEFPGAPRVLVVDENFKVLAATNGAPVEGGVAAKLEIPVTNAKRFALVRDDRWVRPMQFDIGFAQQ